MFGDYSKDLLRSGIIDLKAGDRESARRYLDRALYMSSDHDVMAEAWFWMSQVTDDPVEKRKALENCLSNDMQNLRARRALAILDRKLKSDEIVDPDHLPPLPEGFQQADAQRFMCPKCGGRMTFSPRGESLVCEYCSEHQTINTSQKSPRDNDFIVANATIRGHAKPLMEQVIHCQGCGAEFILPPGQLSASCVYCGSPHVVNLENSKNLLAPDGIIVHSFDQDRAALWLTDWLVSNKIYPEKRVARPRGLYLPLWTFDIGGGIDYTGEVMEAQDLGMGQHAPRLARINDFFAVLLKDVPIPASRKLSAPFVNLISSFNLTAITSYNPRYLADWPAELYDVPMSDASLDARNQAFVRLKQYLVNRITPVRLISTSSARMSIESFRLNLLPVWLTEISLEGRSRLLLINGNNGAVSCDFSRKLDSTKAGVRGWLHDLVKD